VASVASLTEEALKLCDGGLHALRAEAWARRWRARGLHMDLSLVPGVDHHKRDAVLDIASLSEDLEAVVAQHGRHTCAVLSKSGELVLSHLRLLSCSVVSYHPDEAGLWPAGRSAGV